MIIAVKPRFSEGTVLALAALLAAAFPYLVVRFVPSADLPQHLAQIRLFVETLSGQRAGNLTIHWFYPNTLVYVLVGVMWALFPPILSGKMTMLALALFWSGSIFVLARVFDRPRESALMASVLTLNASFYWGFINFLSGWPVFVLWLVLLRRAQGDTSQARTFLLTALCGFVLFFSHALWLAAALGALAVVDLVERKPLRLVVRQALAVAPVLVIAVIWYPHITAARSANGFDTSAHWQTLPWERLTPAWISEAALGGLRGPYDVAIMAVIVLWGTLALISRRNDLRSTCDMKIGAVGLLLLTVSLVAPDKYLNTISFGSRWVPAAFVLLLLSLPRPNLPRGLTIALPLVVIVAYSLITAIVWRTFEQEDLSGLSESLEAIPEGARTLGLDFVQESKYVKGRPFLQTFAYAQVLRGGELNFSFVSHGSGIVAAAVPAVNPWTVGLEWFPERVETGDLVQFDIALVNGTEGLHRKLQGRVAVVPLTSSGRWRAYRCPRTPAPQGRSGSAP